MNINFKDLQDAANVLPQIDSLITIVITEGSIINVYTGYVVSVQKGRGKVWDTIGESINIKDERKNNLFCIGLKSPLYSSLLAVNIDRSNTKQKVQFTTL